MNRHISRINFDHYPVFDSIARTKTLKIIAKNNDAIKRRWRLTKNFLWNK